MRITAPAPDDRVGLDGIDLADADLYARGDPHLVWQTLRAQCPVYWNPRPFGSGFWAVTRHSTVRRVLRDYETFTSERGTVLWMLGIPDPAARKMMAVTDPPRHTEIREQVGRPFAPHLMSGNDAWVRALVRRTIAPAWDDAEWDVAAGFARLPVASVVAMMALPDEDVEHLLRWTYASIAPMDPHYATGPVAATLMQAHHEIVEYFTGAIRGRRAALGDDLLSHLMTMEVAGRRLTEEEVVVNCYSLLLGASVTTSQAIVAPLVSLAELHGGTGRWPADAPISTAVEEALRWSSPTMHFMRYAVRDVRLDGTLVRAGDAVVAWIASANRDESVFTEPYAFQPRRAPNRHITFGSGVHRCVGHPLARLTLRIVAEEFLAKLDRFELSGPVVHLRSNAAAGVVSAPMRCVLRPEARPAWVAPPRCAPVQRASAAGRAP